MLLAIVVDVPFGANDTVSKIVSSTVTVDGSTDVVVDERDRAGEDDGGADEASSWATDLDSNVIDEVVVFMNLDATSLGRRPASRTGEYFNAFAVGARMDAKASVAVHAGMEFFIVKMWKVKETSECGAEL